MSDLGAYTVIGIHDGGEQNRFAESYLAHDPADAECQALTDHPDLLIAGVAEGAQVRMVDTDVMLDGALGEDIENQRSAEASA